MFTGIEADEKDRKLIESLGGTHVTDISECTILVTNKVCIVYSTGSAPFMHTREPMLTSATHYVSEYTTAVPCSRPPCWGIHTSFIHIVDSL
jgi:hypothetical protein